MATTGVVRSWDEGAGFGVVDSPQTPGGCWVHFSAVAVEGYASLDPGGAVTLEWEPARQDGYAYRAVRVWPADGPPTPQQLEQPGAAPAYGSRSTLTDGDAGTR